MPSCPVPEGTQCCLEVVTVSLQAASVAGCHVGRTGGCGWPYRLPTAVGMVSTHHTPSSFSSRCLPKTMIHTGKAVEQIAGHSQHRPKEFAVHTSSTVLGNGLLVLLFFSNFEFCIIH